MNTPERNKKKITQMQKLGKIYSESDEDKSENRVVNQALENATREYPLPTARKFAWVICGGFWFFCLLGFLFGVNIPALLPFLFFSLAGVSLVHIPMFWVKKKLFDIVVAIIFAISCVGLSISMLVR
ncbi:MAG: hypothetical protein FWG83_00715 [Oscillospiraceae bacterium]|nr:hypothetical protein [Oscillospiraceae bacterium]